MKFSIGFLLFFIARVADSEVKCFQIYDSETDSHYQLLNIK